MRGRCGREHRQRRKTHERGGGARANQLAHCGCSSFQAERRLGIGAHFASRTAASAQPLSKSALMHDISPVIAVGVFLSTAATDAVYVLFNAAVAARRRVGAASWSSLWYLLSAFAVISYTKTRPTSSSLRRDRGWARSCPSRMSAAPLDCGRRA